MKPQFALAGSLTNATQVGGVWETAQLSMTVMDKEGIYLLSNVAVGDIVNIDSSAYEGGLVAPYRVTNIVSRSGTALVVNATFNEAGAAPDLSWCIGASVVVGRAGAKGSMPVVAPGVQGLGDKLPFALLDQSLRGAVIPKGATAVTFANGKVAGLTVGTNVYVFTYGANGLTSVTKNGAAYFSVTYASGVPTAVVFA